jgi:uncharacterized membrane protein YwzB
MNLIALLVAVIVICLVFWAIKSIMAAFATPPQIQTVVTVIFVLIVVLWLVGQGLLGGGPILRLH